MTLVYKLYSLPNCYKCIEVEEFLKQKNIPHTKINLTTPVGRAAYKEVREQFGEEAFKRDSSGALLLPILIETGVNGNESKIEKILQDVDDIKKYFETK